MSVARARFASDHDQAMARIGFDRCPHIGIYCPGPENKGPEKCRGKEECVRIQFKPWIAGLFEERREAV